MDQLVTVAADTAMKAAVQYIHANGLGYDLDALLACLRANVKARFQEALADSKRALDANMGKIAEQTFLATMALAGIDAAKEASFPKCRYCGFVGAGHVHSGPHQ